MKHCFLFISLLLTAFSVHADVAAHLEKADGIVVLKSKGVQNMVKKDQPLLEGDEVMSMGNSIVKFIDGQSVFLKSGTTLKIDKYQYDQIAPENGSAAMYLVKGGLRAVTGLIKKNYELKTNYATIGIRGTQYSASVEQDKLSLEVQDGEIVVENKKGAALLKKNEFGVIRDMEEALERGASDVVRVVVPKSMGSSCD